MPALKERHDRSLHRQQSSTTHRPSAPLLHQSSPARSRSASPLYQSSTFRPRSPCLQQSSTSRARSAPPTASRPQLLASSEYSLARSLSILACFEGYHTSDSPESVHPSVASQKQPKSSKHAPNRKALLRERLRRIVRVINATYAVCKGFPLDPETRFEAWNSSTLTKH